MMQTTRLATAVFAAALAQGAFAAVSADEAKQLGTNLTLFGAEKAGNKDGTIPAYSGKAQKAPSSYNKADKGQRPDPYKEKPLFSITAANAAQYADKLDGMIELFKKYPNYRMDVYPSHRDYVYPKFVLDNSVKNAISCKGSNEDLKLEGCYGGIPFPIPKTGRQVMWNHLLQYNATTYAGKTNSWVTPPSGQAVLQTVSENMSQYEFYDPSNSKPNASDMQFWQFMQIDLSPVRKTGGKLVVLDSLDMVGVGRRVYQYIPGQRRVKLAPNLAYDTPSPNSGGASTMDDAKSFAGALDRYDFKLSGKKEKFIMYNNHMLNDGKVCPDEKVANNANFPHPDCVRWELHRVWKVEAKLNPAFRHVYHTRVFYWDEDVPGAGSVENYDASGKLYRLMNQVNVPFYEEEKGGGNNDGTVAMDLQTGSWAFQGSVGFSGAGWWPIDRLDSRFFTPEAMTGTGIR